jgi:Flp pilus assembly protein TadG
MSRISRRLARHRSDATRGQALVEFAMTVVLFILLVMGVLDFGRAIFMYNGLSQASRELARVTSVHPGTPLGTSAQTAAVIADQEGLVPDLDVTTADFSCEDLDGDPVATACLTGNWVRVDLSVAYTPVTPMLTFLLGTIDMQSSSSVQITNH